VSLTGTVSQEAVPYLVPVPGALVAAVEGAETGAVPRLQSVATPLAAVAPAAPRPPHARDCSRQQQRSSHSLHVIVRLHAHSYACKHAYTRTCKHAHYTYRQINLTMTASFDLYTLKTNT